MKQTLVMLALVGMALIPYAADAEPFVPLFNGSDLSGWHEVGGGKWTASNGEIIGETGDGSYGWLVTGRRYFDFVLELQFKPEGKGNSGIQLRSHVIDGEMYGYQAECDPSYGMFTGGIYEEKGRGWLQKPDPKLDKVLKPNAWNQYRIEAVGDHFVTYLNGYKMVDFHDGKTIGGIIALQVHSGNESPVKMRWKDIKIIDLGYGPGWEPIFNGKDLNGWTPCGNEKWYVKDGWIVGQAVTDKYGYLATKRKFKSFVLRLQFQADGTGNSGVFFHSFLEGVDITGVQAEIDPTPGNNTGGFYESGHGGRGWIAQPDEAGNAVMQPVGTWNDMEIVIDGNHFTSYVNGYETVNFIDEEQKHFDGVLALQLHSGGQAAMRWRDLYIKVLDE